MSELIVRTPFTPWPHQRTAHMRRERFKVLVWHRRAGKTVYAVNECVEELARCLAEAKQNPRIGYIAPLYRQAKQVAWDYLRDFTRTWPGAKHSESDLSVTINGGRIRLFGADNPDALRGIYFDFVVMDEVAQMRPEVWGEIVRPALADRRGGALFIGTPKGVNTFSQLYYRALRTEDWWGNLLTYRDTNALTDEELKQMRQELTESQWKQEMECDFAAAVENQLISLELAQAAARRRLQRGEYVFAPKVLGVDVARYGDDKSVIICRQGLAAYEPVELKQMDTMVVAAHVMQEIERHDPTAVFVDETGIGAGVLDRVRQLGFKAIGVNGASASSEARFLNLRMQMWWRMAQWLGEGAAIPEHEQLITDLVTPTFEYVLSNNKLKLESKEDMRERGLPSPDFGDALAMTFAYPVQPRTDAYSGLPFQRRAEVSRCKTEYDEYDTNR